MGCHWSYLLTRHQENLTTWYIALSNRAALVPVKGVGLTREMSISINSVMTLVANPLVMLNTPLAQFCKAQAWNLQLLHEMKCQSPTWSMVRRITVAPFWAPMPNYSSSRKANCCIWKRWWRTSQEKCYKCISNGGMAFWRTMATLCDRTRMLILLRPNSSTPMQQEPGNLMSSKTVEMTMAPIQRWGLQLCG